MQRNPGLLVVAFLLVISDIVAQQSNPLLVHSNKPILFDKVNTSIIQSSVNSLRGLSDQRIKRIAAVQSTSRDYNNTLMAFDELGYDLTDLLMKLRLVAGTYQDDSTRNTANVAAGDLSLNLNNLFLNRDLYRALKEFSFSPAASNLKPNHSKFLKENILLFEKNGMKLSDRQAQELKLLNEKLINYGIDFDRNIVILSLHLDT